MSDPNQWYLSGDLRIDGNVTLNSKDSGIYSLQFGRIDESGREHKWALWHMNSQYRKNALEIWEYKTDSNGKACGGDSADGAICGPRLVILEGGNVGIGTSSPTHPLHVKTDWGILALDSNQAGQDAGLRLMEGGLVKWHITNSAQNAKLCFARDGLPATLTFDQIGNVEVGLNPLRFSSGWTSSTDAGANRAEISNDTGDYQALMIVGNNSAGRGRQVSVWDRLTVNGDLTTTRNLIIGAGSNASLLVRHINGKHYQNDSFEGLYLNHDTGQPVHVGGGQESNLYVHGSILTRPISNDRAKEILSNEENGTAIVGAANGLNEARIDFFFKYRNEVYRAFIKGERI